jgi:phosphotransferase system HPr-like phosphotransfer protein
MDDKELKFFYAKKCRVGEPTGLCARPCAAIVTVVERFNNLYDCEIFIRHVDPVAAKYPVDICPGGARVLSIMSLMMLRAYCGAELEVYTTRKGFESAVDEIANVVENYRIHG